MTTVMEYHVITWTQSLLLLGTGFFKLMKKKQTKTAKFGVFLIARLARSDPRNHFVSCFRVPFAQILE